MPLKQWICLQSLSWINARSWALTDAFLLTWYFLVATLLAFWILQHCKIAQVFKSWLMREADTYEGITSIYMYVQPNLSVQTEVYKLLYGFGICLAIRRGFVLFWAFSWFLIPACQLRGFCVQLLFLTFTSCISWCITALYREQCWVLSRVLKKWLQNFTTFDP